MNDYTLLSKDDEASPQGGGALCAIKVYEVEFSNEILEDEAGVSFNLGPLPEKGNSEKLWRFSHVTTSAYEGIDAGTGVRVDVGIEGDQYRFAFVNAPTLLNSDIEYNARNHGSKFPDADLLLTLRTMPTTAETGKMRVVLWGWS